MGSYRPLGNLQKDIVITIANSPKLLVTNQIAKILDKDQTTVFKSVESLIANGSLLPEREEKGIRKYLKLTDKGVCHAVMDGQQDYETILQKHPYLRPFQEVDLLRKVITNPTLRSHVYREIAIITLDKDEFNYLPDGYVLKIRHRESSIERRYEILQAITTSIRDFYYYGVNRDEINRFIQDLRKDYDEAFSAKLKFFDKYDRYAKAGKIDSSGKLTSF